jgi:hypothetical protein
MHRQQRGNDAETHAETWDAIHLRFTVVRAFHGQ